MNNFFQKLTSLFILIVFVSTGVLVSFPLALAQELDPELRSSPVEGIDLDPKQLIATESAKCAGGAVVEAGFKLILSRIPGLPGGKVPVDDFQAQLIALKDNADDCIWRIVQQGTKIMMARFVERAVDNTMDGLIDWIINEGEPRFLNVTTIFQDAADAAAGDTLVEIGLGNFCSPIQKFRLQLQLERPVFSERISCTLSQVAGNFEDFGNSFAAGGWIGYQELLKPQNNRWGLELLAQDELARRTTEAEKRAGLRYEVAGGFEEVIQCLLWRAADENGNEAFLDDSDDEWEPIYASLKHPPIFLEKDGVRIATRWTCNITKVTSPPGAVQGGYNAAAVADFSYRTDPDFSPYLRGLGNALAIRAVREGFDLGSKVFSSSRDEAERLVRAEAADPDAVTAREIADRQRSIASGDRDDAAREVSREGGSTTGDAQEGRSLERDLIARIGAVIDPGGSLDTTLSAVDALLSPGSPPNDNLIDDPPVNAGLAYRALFYLTLRDNPANLEKNHLVGCQQEKSLQCDGTDAMVARAAGVSDDRATLVSLRPTLTALRSEVQASGSNLRGLLDALGRVNAAENTVGSLHLQYVVDQAQFEALLQADLDHLLVEEIREDVGLIIRHSGDLAYCLNGDQFAYIDRAVEVLGCTVE
jgi:hypothetical protein